MSGRRRTMVELAPVATAVVITLVIAASGVQRRSMYGTEEATMWVARLPAHRIFDVLANTDAVHGTYYLLVHGVFDVFGSSVTTLRLPSVVGTVATIVLVAVITKRLTGSTAAAAIASIVTSITPYIAFYELSGRSYALDTALALGATLALLRALDEPAAHRWTRWVGYAGLLALGGYMHEMTLLVIASHAVTLMLARVRRRDVLSWTLSALGGLLAVVPLLVVSVRERRQLSWIRTPGRHAMWLLVRDFFGPSRIAVFLMLALIVIGALPLRRRLDLRSVALPLFVAPTVLLLAESRVETPLYGGPRYVLYSLPAGIMLATLGLMHVARALARTDVRTRVATAALGVVVIAATDAPGLMHLRSADAYPQNFGAAATYVDSHARPGDADVLVGQGYELLPLGYPRDFRDVTNLATAQSPLRASNYYGLIKPVAAIREAMLHHNRIWAIGALNQRGRGRYRLELDVLHRQFSAVERVDFRGVGVALFERGRGAGDSPALTRRTGHLP